MNKRIVLLLALLLPVLSYSATIKEQAAGNNSLSKAAAKGDVSRVRLLLKQGVNPNGSIESNGVYEDEEEFKLVYFSQMTSPPILTAAEHGHVEVVQLLLDAGANPNLCCCSCVTALHEAIIKKNERMVKLLLEKGADASIVYDADASCEELARKSGSKKILEMVLKAKK